jgi:hypothetical protein
MSSPKASRALNPTKTRVSRPSYRGCEPTSMVEIGIRKIGYRPSHQGDIHPTGTHQAGPLGRLEEDAGGHLCLGGVLAEAARQHGGETLRIPQWASRVLLEHPTEERYRPTGLCQGRLEDGRVGREAAAPQIGEDDLPRATGNEPEQPGVGQAAQKGPVADPAVGEGRGEGVDVGSTAGGGRKPTGRASAPWLGLVLSGLRAHRSCLLAREGSSSFPYRAPPVFHRLGIGPSGCPPRPGPAPILCPVPTRAPGQRS